MVAEQEVVYNIDGKDVRFKIRRIKFGEYQKVMSGLGNIELIGGVSKGRIDMTKMVDEIMKLSVSSPDSTDFHQLDVQQGLNLQEKVLELNGMGGTPDTFPVQ